MRNHEITRKQLLLKTIYAYIAHSGRLYDTDCLSLFGTNSFNLVWEGICADIMDNQLDVRLGALQLPTPLKPEYDRKQKLIDLIEKPLWSVTGKTASDTLIPDLVSITGNKFIIFDAKYYNAVLEPGQPPKAQPGIESVTKQYYMASVIGIIVFIICATLTLVTYSRMIKGDNEEVFQ